MPISFKDFKEILQTNADKELSEIETFSDDMCKHINETYERLLQEREDWLKQKEEQL